VNRLDQARAQFYNHRNYRLQNFAARRAKNLVKPTFICFKLSERCNSKCVHCDIWIHNKDEGELSTEQWKAVMDNIRSWAGPVNVVFTGGEVFLRKDTMELIRYGSRLGLVIEVLTNGLMTPRAKCEELVLAGPKQVTLSLDGRTPETHFSIRRIPKMYEKIVQTINDLDEFRNKHRTDLDILLKTVIMKPNFHEILDLVDWVKEEGKATIMVQPITQNYAQEKKAHWYKDSDLWIEDAAAVEQLIHQLIERKKNGWPLYNRLENLESIIAHFQAPEQAKHQNSGKITGVQKQLCIAGVSSMVFSANGDVQWCYRMPPVGNVKETTAQALWENRPQCWKTHCGYF
jgi:AdoMet-dependent heme synthase